MSGEAVKVIVRCRPMNTKEKGLNCSKIVKVDQNTLQVSLLKPENGNSDPKSFTFDGVYDDDSRQKDVYDDTAYALVNSVIEGYNGTIFAYGQTGCGKTFTMEGVKEVAELRGIIPNTFDQIFNAIQMNPDANKKFLVQASYIEIYNEEVRDLLGDNPKARCDVKEDVERGVFIKGLTKTVVNNVAQINQIMTNGNKNRSVGATLMNADSSRSHSIFTINIETSEPVENTDEQRIRAGKLNLVDLAGSERQSKTQAAGDRLKEATKINLSLSALGNVISALVSGKDHIPYRDSKLTRLLQDSLGGNTKTIMIACFSPADYNYEETLSTLRYANRAKNIKNKPKINEDPKDALLREYQDEIKRLKALLEGRGIDSNGTSSSSDGTQSTSKKRGSAPSIQQDDGDDEISEDGDGDSKTGDVDAVTVAQRRKVKQSRVEMEEDVAAMNIEKERHEQFAQQLQEQMALERAKLEQERASLEERIAAKDENAIAEIRKHEELAQELEQRMQQERLEHEEQAQELSEKMEKEKQRHNDLVNKLKEIKHQSKEEKQALKEKMKKLQAKMMAGGQTIKDLKLIQEEQARQAAYEAKEMKKKQQALKDERERAEEEKLLAEESLLNAKDDLTDVKKKFKKLRKKYKLLQDEMSDNTTEFESEKEGYLNNIRDIYRELRLYKLICESFLTRPDIEKIVKNSTFDDDRDTWQLPRIDLPVLFPTIRVRTTIPPKPNGIVITKPDHDSVAADAGWKKSVIASLDMDGSPRNDGYNKNTPSRLNPMGGNGGTRSRGNSEDVYDDMPRKANFSGGASFMKPEDMPDPRKRGVFEPAGIIPESSTSSLPTTMPKMRPAFQPAIPPPRSPSPNGITADAHVKKRPVFDPHGTGVDLSPSPTNSAIDVLNRAPKARANFQPAILTQSEDKDDPLHMPLSRPKFEPART